MKEILKKTFLALRYGHFDLAAQGFFVLSARVLATIRKYYVSTGFIALHLVISTILLLFLWVYGVGNPESKAFDLSLGLGEIILYAYLIVPIGLTTISITIYLAYNGVIKAYKGFIKKMKPSVIKTRLTYRRAVDDAETAILAYEGKKRKRKRVDENPFIDPEEVAYVPGENEPSRQRH